MRRLPTPSYKSHLPAISCPYCRERIENRLDGTDLITAAEIIKARIRYRKRRAKQIAKREEERKLRLAQWRTITGE